MNFFLLLIVLLFSFCKTFSQQFDHKLLQKGIDFYNKGSFDSSIQVLTNCLPLALKSEDSLALQSIYTNLGNSYSSIGKTELALNFYQHGLDIAEGTKDSVRIGKITSNIGVLYSDIKDFPKGLAYFDKAEKIATSVKEDETIADCANGKAVIYEQLFKYDKALVLYFQALQIYQKHKMQDRIALTYNNLGIVYKQLNKLDKTIYYYEKALEITERIDAKYITAAISANLANVYMLQKQYAKSEKANFLAMEKAREIDAKAIIVEVHGNLMDLYSATKDYKKAYEFAKTYKESNDSLINVERTAQLAEMKEKYETEKKDAENFVLQNKNKIKTLELKKQALQINNRNYLLLSVLLILILSVIAAWLYLSRQKVRNKILREQAIRSTEELERKRISRDLHDDLGSGLAKIKLLSEITSRKVQDNAIKRNIHALSETASQIAVSLKDMVWALNPDNATIAQLITKIRESSFDYLEDLPIKLHFSTPDEIPETAISRETNSNILFIIKECLQNIVKHAEAKNVYIHFQIADKKNKISIKDDGIGMPASFKSGNGIINIQQRIEKIGGKVISTSEVNEGLELMLEF
ncbi:MAG TPA: tetratricopeptide repeat protein [Edaphocola sp.]|nr:tetratricopeptide repeat protein [Edaphocola sp.]